MNPDHLPTIYHALTGTLRRDDPWAVRPGAPAIACLTCGVLIGGVAQVGHPCPFCDDTLRDLTREVLALAALYDGARWCFLQAEAQRA